MPPIHPGDFPPLEIAYLEPISRSNLNILVGPDCYYYFPHDSILRSDHNGMPSILEVETPSLTIMGQSQLLDLLCEHSEECPNYPIKITILPEARFGQMMQMLMWMRTYKVRKYILTRVSDSERCAVEDLDGEIDIEQVIPRCQVEPYQNIRF